MLWAPGGSDEGLCRAGGSAWQTERLMGSQRAQVRARPGPGKSRGLGLRGPSRLGLL